MRKFIILLLLVLFGVEGYAQIQLKSEVNEGFELTSIAFRLAGAEEYSLCEIPEYTEDIDSYFADFSDHNLIHFIQEIRQKYGIAYDAIAVAAAMLKIENENVKIKEGVQLSDIDKYDHRWSEEIYREFVLLLDDFYKKTKFNSFFIKHKFLYKEVEKQTDALLEYINTEWFTLMFGKVLGPVIIIASPSNGPCNYAFSIPDNRHQKGIAIGYSIVDQDDYSMYIEMRLPIIIHELLHHIANPIIDDIWPDIECAAQKIYSETKKNMQDAAIGSAKAAMKEWLTNLLAYKYLYDNGTSDHYLAYRMTSYQILHGLIWMERSVSLLHHFADHRDIYPYFYNFISQIIEFLNFTAENIEHVINEYKNQTPYVIDTFPVSGSKIHEPINLITIRFSLPMNVNANGALPIDNNDILPLPLTAQPYWKDEYTYAIPIKYSLLQKNKTYGIRLIREFTQSAKLYVIQNDYLYTIKF